jgi:hypothetical protein
MEQMRLQYKSVTFQWPPCNPRQHNMLHFVLAMMKPEMASQLFPDEAIMFRGHLYQLRYIHFAATLRSCSNFRSCSSFFLAGSQEVVSSEEHEKLHSVPGTTSPSWRKVSKTGRTLCSDAMRCSAMQDCAELTHGFFALREICETGPPLSISESVCSLHNSCD